jgi:isoleucyl-tRNA synthetase
VSPDTGRKGEGAARPRLHVVNVSLRWAATRCVVPAGFDPARVAARVDRWILGEFAAAVAAVDAALAGFRFNEAAGAAYQFVWGTFCDWYLEFAKPVLGGADEGARAETRAVCGNVLRGVLQLLHPEPNSTCAHRIHLSMWLHTWVGILPTDCGALFTDHTP